MNARVERDAGRTPANSPADAQAAAEAQAIAFDPDDRYSGPALPADHPRWMRDTLSISQRARTLLASLKPVAVRVFGIWEHRVRSIVVAGRRLCVDQSGSYRFD